MAETGRGSFMGKKAMIKRKRVSAMEDNGGLRDRERVKYLVKMDKRGGEFERGGERERERERGKRRAYKRGVREKQ